MSEALWNSKTENYKKSNQSQRYCTDVSFDSPDTIKDSVSQALKQLPSLPASPHTSPGQTSKRTL